MGLAYHKSTGKGHVTKKHNTTPDPTNKYHIKRPVRTDRNPSGTPTNSTSPWHPPSTDGLGNGSRKLIIWGGNNPHEKTIFTTKPPRTADHTA